MKRLGKKSILILLAIIIIITSIILVLKYNTYDESIFPKVPPENTGEVIKEYVQFLEDGTKLNISNELRKNKLLDGLEITNIEIREKNGISTLRADVENKTSVNSKQKNVKITIINKDGEKITELKGIIDPIKIGEKTKLSIAVPTDISNAYDFNIENN